VRHAGSGGPNKEEWIQRWLFETNRVGVHFDPIASFNSDDYDYGATEIDYLNSAASDPVLLVVGFSELPKRKKYITKVEPDSREVHAVNMESEEIVEFINIDSPQRRNQDFESKHGESCTFEKTIKVNEWIPVSFIERQPLWRWHSQSTIHGPNNSAEVKKEYVNAIYNNEPVPETLESLSSDNQELIAERWLRNHFENFQLDAARGGVLEHIDILGSTDSSRIVASVTSASSYTEERIKSINEFADETKAFFFGRSNKRPDKLHPNVTYVSLSEVFDWMNTDNTRRQESLRVMLGY